MKRVLISKPGGHERLELVDGAEPDPGPGQVRVSVRAAGVNYADTIVRLGYYEAAKGLYPLTPGFEFSGQVNAAGSGVSRLRMGDRVFGFTRFGGYTTSICVSEKQLLHCPKNWDFPECAGFPAVFLTAYHALFKVAKVEAGETLLIHSAAGGVGLALVQLSKIAGCRSIGVVGSKHKVSICLKLGAEAVIDRSTQNLWAEAERLAPRGYDVIFDANGVSTLKAGFSHLAQGGRLVVYGFADIFPRGADKPSLLGLARNYLRIPKFSPLEMTASNRAVMGFNVVFLFNSRIDWAASALATMMGWVEEGKIQKLPMTLWPLEKVAQAHRDIESGKTSGKIVLTV